MLAFLANKVSAQIYKDSTQTIEARVNDLLNRMTQEEKFWQVFMVPADVDSSNWDAFRHGIFGIQLSASSQGDAGGQLLNYNTTDNALTFARKVNQVQRQFVTNTRLGIPIIPFDEALHGLVRSDATCFPQSIAMAATFDTTLVRRATEHIAYESRIRGIRQILSPVVNLATDVRWGRTEETYGEDPFLSAQMGLAFVRSFERNGIVATPKHFVANVGDGGRDSYPIHLSERYLYQSHFIPFIAAIKQGGVRSIMTAYNSLNGVACSSNSWLLNEQLKAKWGFEGFVISDANAVGGELVLHKTAGSYAESGAHAINGGLDVIFQTDVNHYKLFYPAFTNNSINQQRLDDAVKRVLRAKFELGLFENPYISEDINEEKAHSEGKTLARKVAQESFVLLKNENAALPLLGEAQTIAVIGVDATEARLGGYSGPGFQKVNILDGIKEQAGDAEVLYTEGVGRNSIEHELVKCAFNAEYFDNLELKGAPVLMREEEKVDGHWTLFSPNEKLKVDHFSVRWTGEFTSPASGEFEIGLEGNDGFRLYVNDELIINRWLKQSYRKELVKYNFKKGKKYKIRVEFFESQGEGKIRLISNLFMKNDSEKKLSEAVKTAKKADIAVVVVGIEEGEFRDRASLKLPGKQEEMIKAIAATGKPVVVLIVGGSAVNMNAWINDVDAIGMLWYPGEEGGRAVADILFGKVNPAGRLPITFPLDEAQLPLVYNHEPTGRGNDYNNLSGQPLFPFGFGLSYTTFIYSDIELEKTVIGTSESTKVRLKVKNTGGVDGDEVVQLYIQDELSSVVRAVLELKGFQRIHLKAGEEKELEFKITPEMLAQLDLELNSFVEAGIFRIMIGGSSRDLRLKTELEVK